MDKTMRVGVIGTGHVGLVSCASFAAIGHDVIGADQDAEKIGLLQSGTAPFFEPGLQDLLTEQLSAGSLSFTEDVAAAIRDREVVLICVGTPARAAGDANLVAVEKAVREVCLHATGRCVIVEKSTVPTGTATRVSRIIAREGRTGEIEVVANPEFLREGHAVEDSLNPDRIVVGAETEWALETMRRLYAPLVDKGCRLIEQDIATAELSKHASNAFLALKISFINAVARICERAGADVTAVADIMGQDPRIGRAFLDAGIGWGGSCFPKDLQAFDRISSRLGYDFPLLREIARLNSEAVDAALDKIEEALWNPEEKTVTLMGLAFKPGTDDIRFAPALAIAEKLMANGTRVVGYDPLAGAAAKAEVPGLEVATDPYDAATGAHCVVICTEWDEVKGLDLARLKAEMAEAVVVDGRNVFDPAAMEAAGFSYYPTGRPAVG